MIPEPADLGDDLQEPWGGEVGFEPGMLLLWKGQEGQAGRKNPCAQALSPLIGWCHFRKTAPRISRGPSVVLHHPTPHQGGQVHRALSDLPAGKAHAPFSLPHFLGRTVLSGTCLAELYKLPWPGRRLPTALPRNSQEGTLSLFLSQQTEASKRSHLWSLSRLGQGWGGKRVLPCGELLSVDKGCLE